MNLTLFDLDGTLIETDSDHAFGEFLVSIGWVDGDAFRRRNDAFYEDYQAARLDIAAYIDFATAPWRGRPESEALAMRERFMCERMRPGFDARALALVRRHQSAGDHLAIVTATNEFITRPIADAFGVADLIAVELARDDNGVVTGGVRGVPSFREGKIVRVEQWLAGQGLRHADFDRITFYSDSTNDLPLLEWATHPVATNPGPVLASVARERGWPVLNLFKEEEP
ncbi:MAG: HAD-IB family hydrolase [Pseudomonadota bacterium]